MWSSIAGAVAGLVSPIAGFFTAKEKTKQDVIALDSTKEVDTHGEQSDADKGLAAEETAAQSSTDKSWWHSFIDGLNRLPRPLMALMVIAIMIYCPYDPERFGIVMMSYNLMPQWMALIIGQVILLFCGGRMLDKWNGTMSVDPTAIASTLKQISDMRDMVKLRDARDAPGDAKSTTTTLTAPQLEKMPVEAPRAFDTEMKNTSVPMTNGAIAEWNRRRAQKPPA